jgi:hypothetical protein
MARLVWRRRASPLLKQHPSDVIHGDRQVEQCFAFLAAAVLGNDLFGRVQQGQPGMLERFRHSVMTVYGHL